MITPLPSLKERSESCDARAILTHLRDGMALSEAELQWFCAGLADGRVSDAQAGAFAMAIVLNGLAGNESRNALVRAMRDTGNVMAWDLPGPVMDKHSTGGVGDCVSLLLAPALAVCGVYVPMIAGRGLGHTGGTLDKLEAIPGFCTALTESDLRAQVTDIGCAIVAASPELAPADRRLYAIRDATTTVESIDLITASILSKKLAAGLDGLVLDVKCGSGAFLKTKAQAQKLAQALVSGANAAGCASRALITDMNQPLIEAAGNALEVAAAMRILRGNLKGYEALWEVTCALGGEVLTLAELVEDPEEGYKKVATTLHSGAALERFGQMVTAQGGRADFTEKWQQFLPMAPVQCPVYATDEGVVTAINTHALGLCVVRLGGGRMRDGGTIDPAVGLSDMQPLGAVITPSDPPLAVIHAKNESSAQAAEKVVQEAYRFGTVDRVLPVSPVIESITTKRTQKPNIF